MKTKLDMAMQMIVAEVRRVGITSIDSDKVIDAWNLADAMQAEADKREKEKQSEHVFEAVDEWQPDWSQAPDWANWWVATANQSGKITGGWFYDAKPEFGFGVGPSVYYSMNGNNNAILVDSFGYTGDWRNSLRKRPK